MRILDTILGRTKPASANLDALFGLPGAVITLQAARALVPTGQAGICYKPAAGQPFAATEQEFGQLLGLSEGDTSATTVHRETDKYGYDWVVLTNADFETLVNQVHLVNTTLKEQGYESMLLCSVFGWRPEAAAAGSSATAYLVYLYKRGTFYPFVPLAGNERRDPETEMTLQAQLSDDLSIEKDKQRWMALWGLPVR